jgi:hypothetical protein
MKKHRSKDSILGWSEAGGRGSSRTCFHVQVWCFGYLFYF